jgi:hypothetical protein
MANMNLKKTSCSKNKCEPFLSQDIDKIRQTYKQKLFEDCKFPATSSSIFDVERPGVLEQDLRKHLFLSENQKVLENITWQRIDVSVYLSYKIV